MVYYKVVDFDRTEAGLTSKCQQFNGAIRTSLTAPYDNVRRRTTMYDVAQKFVTQQAGRQTPTIRIT